ncbi:MAG: hypothetical protein LBK92_00545 [Endomicrobium sp.]|jgi:hypothetical protein|nr:hypothetical protein [Endomicrobium sp.]
MIKKIFSFILISSLGLNIQPSSCFAAKRDVQDPVLREIINEFGNKIPKFTNKYGDSVFVQDGSVTRADFITALYEYDKRTREAAKAPAGMNSQTISRNEFDDIKNKVAMLEKNGRIASAPVSSKSKGGTDIVRIIADLEPNMPMLLDNSLRYSKVFNELEQQVNSGGGRSVSKGTPISKKELAEIKRTLSQLQSDYIALSKKIDKLNSSLPETERYDKNKNIELVRLSKQLKEMKKTISETSHTQYYDNFGSPSCGGKNTGKLAGVSLGLSMIAALFVSR